MRIAVVGAGAIGSFFGASLAASGNDVMLVDIQPAQIEAIRANGVTVRRASGDQRVAVHAGTAEAFSAVADLVLLCTKTFASAQALHSVAHLIGPATLGLTLQNGVGNGTRMSGFIPPERVAVGVTTWPADLEAPGVVSVRGEGEVRLWSHDGHSHAWIPGLVAVFAAAGLECQADRDVQSRIWEKVAFNAAMNSIACITGLSVGGMARCEEARQLAAQVSSEVAAVAVASGVPVDSSRIEDSIRFAYAHHAGHKPSMLQDLIAGRPTEIEAINGEVSRLGRSLGVDARTVEALARLVRVLETKRAEGLS